MVSGNGIMRRLIVVLASGKLVRIWAENLLFQLFSGLSQKGREIEIKSVAHSSRDRKKN